MFDRRWQGALCVISLAAGLPSPKALAQVPLVASGPVSASRDGALIENLRITQKGDGCALRVEGRRNVRLRNLMILHEGAGICASDAADLSIEEVDVRSTNAPKAGKHLDDDRFNIRIERSPRVHVTRARLEKGSAGIFLLESPDSALRFIECHDHRGPFPRGQCVQWDKSDRGILEDFSAENPLDTSWTEDNVNVYYSDSVTVRRGLIDGNNSPSGVGVIADNGSDDVTVEDVDLVRTGNSGVSVYAETPAELGRNFTARGVRVRDMFCDDRAGRGRPLSGGQGFTVRPGAQNARFVASQIHNWCHSIAWDVDHAALADIKDAPFEARAPLRLAFPWQVRDTTPPAAPRVLPIQTSR